MPKKQTQEPTDFPKEITALEMYQPLLAIAFLKTEADAKAYAEARQDLKDRLKQIEAIRKKLKDPILEAGKRIDGQASEASKPLLEIVTLIDQRLLMWDQEQEKARIAAEKQKREEELARLAAVKAEEEAAAALDGEEANVSTIETNIARLEAKPIEIDHSIKTGKATVYVQKRWTFSVVDPLKIPREYLMVDEVKLRKYALAMGKDAKVDGVKFYEEASIGGRR